MAKFFMLSSFESYLNKLQYLHLFITTNVVFLTNYNYLLSLLSCKLEIS